MSLIIEETSTPASPSSMKSSISESYSESESMTRFFELFLLAEAVDFCINESQRAAPSSTLRRKGGASGGGKGTNISCGLCMHGLMSENGLMNENLTGQEKVGEFKEESGENARGR